MGAALALAALVAAPVAAVPSAPAARLGIVHVEGNVGGASGGHVALRLGERAWHLRLGAEGLLRLERAPWEDFAFRYAVLGNRPLHVAEIAVAEADARRVEVALTARWLAELEHESAREDRVLDARLVAALAGEASGVPVRGAGLLDPAGGEGAGAPALRRRAEAALAPGGLREALRRTEAALARGPAAGSDGLLAYRERLAERAALRALAEGHPLAAEATVDPARAGARAGAELSAQARRALAAHGRALEADVASLLASARPDRGTALLVLVARHRAVHRSLREGGLRVVDALPAGPLLVEAEAARRRAPELRAVADTLAERVDAGLRDALADGSLDDAEARSLEDAASRAVEAARAADGERGVRAAPESPVPSRPRELAVPVRREGEALVALRARAAAARRAVEAASREGRAYQLVLRNCATELLRTLQEALGGPEAAARALGGRLEPGEAGSFVPFLLHHHARERFRLAGETHVPSWRARRVAARYAEEPDAWVALRESNVVTSSVYQPRDRDGSFLFFTDDVFWLRPLYGAVNLGVGLVDATLGLATAPFDGGRRLRRGGRGMLFSAPELVFANVRKGSFDAASLPREAEGAATAP